MAKYKLIIVNKSKSFRFNGNKFETRLVVDNQEVLSRLHNDGCRFVKEIKEKAKVKPQKIAIDETTKEDGNGND